MTKGADRVIYKPDPKSTEVFFVYITNAYAYNHWLENPNAISINEVVQSFDIFFTERGEQGIFGKPSNQQLDNTFGTHNDMEVVQAILRGGTLHGNAHLPVGSGATNFANTSMIDTRGPGPMYH